ncbi:unnamed protein product [Caenorhabditis angaria]|uniref:Glycoprotein hormone subunit beta domain-containing protein n=1 Tax=Caenorhabditis angaria TaxID=860376 RepID=A0A9P1IQS7_9PELO|nr:unnamed protein product [Caenorhabditis angaria]
MKILFFLFILYLNSKTTVLAVENCEFSLRKIPGFDPLILTDKNGRQCRGSVELPFCKGYCRSSEAGSIGFPSKTQNSSACILIKTSERRVPLSDCDEGASDEIRFIKLPHGTSCKCSILPIN